MRSFALGMASLVLCACTTFSKNEEAAELHMRVGTGHMSAGNYPQALAELIEAEKLDSSNPLIQNSLGTAYFLRERLDLAEVHFRKALDIKADYSEARNNLARTLIERGKYSDAVSEAKKVIQDLTYNHPEKAFLHLGMAEFKLGKFQQAKTSFMKSIEIQRENCLAQSYFGRTLYELKDYRRSSEALDRAVGFCQRIMFDEPHYYSALAYYQLGNVSKSEARFEELIKLYPDGRYREKAKSMLETIRR